MWQNKNHTPNFQCFGNRDMFNKYINQLVVCWFTKYILTEKSNLDQKIRNRRSPTYFHKQKWISYKGENILTVYQNILELESSRFF